LAGELRQRIVLVGDASRHDARNTKDRGCRYERDVVMTAITVVDVGPRDGLQNEPVVLDPVVRAALCDRLADAGLPRMEAARFVHPKLVPQMAGAEEVMASIQRKPGVIYAGLVLNERGYDRAVAADVDAVHYTFAVSDSFAARNQNSTVADSIALALKLSARAKADGKRFVIPLSTAFGCPFEGPIDPGKVLDVIARVQEGVPDEIVLCDTIGVAVPGQVRELVAGAQRIGVLVGCHFHDTRTTGIANALAAVEAGVRVLDASVGGTGGCPFAPRATGNIATEDLVYMLHGMGYETGIDLDALIGCAEWLAGQLGKDLPGRVYRAGPFPSRAA